MAAQFFLEVLEPSSGSVLRLPIDVLLVHHVKIGPSCQLKARAFLYPDVALSEVRSFVRGPFARGNYRTWLLR